MLKVVVISPFRGNTDLNLQYAMACMKDCIDRDEAPFASHVLYPLILEDSDPDERETGMSCGQEWMLAADLVAVYTDMGVSTGMQNDLDFARNHNIRVMYRTLPSEMLDSVRGK